MTTALSVLTTTMVRVLASGTVVTVDKDGLAHRVPADRIRSCSWEIQVPSGNPEPDQESDLWSIVPCGAAAVTHDDGFRCANGHHHADYCSPAGRVQELDDWAMERAEAACARNF